MDMKVPSSTLHVLCAAMGLIAVAVRPAAADDVVKMEFQGFGPAGLHVLTTHTIIEEAPAWYAIEGDFSTAGLGAFFANIANRSVTQGREIANKPEPITFNSETERNGVVQHLRVDFKPGGAPDGSVTPPPKEPVTPVNFNQLTGTVDNLTAYLLLERQLARSGGCDLRVPVFDGRHRYDLQFSEGGRQFLSPAEGQNFQGETHACRMARTEIGGFYVDKKHEEGASSGTIWYAPLLPGGDLAVPVRMEMQTEIGNVALFLAELHSHAVNLKFMD